MWRTFALALMFLTGCAGEPAGPPERPRASAHGVIPRSGPADVGGVQLPAGTHVHDALWQTDEPPDDPVELWAQLAAVFGETGLWPVLLESRAEDLELAIDPRWEDDARRDADDVLRELWERNVKGEGAFRPLAREGPDRLGGGIGQAAGGMERVAALALVAVRRPADAPAAMGWSGPVNWFEEGGFSASVLRSWEERYDAVLVGLGLDTLHLAVRRPPQGGQAHAVAREIHAFCPDAVVQGAGSLFALGNEIDGESAWSLWWD